MNIEPSVFIINPVKKKRRGRGEGRVRGGREQRGRSCG